MSPEERQKLEEFRKYKEKARKAQQKLTKLKERIRQDTKQGAEDKKEDFRQQNQEFFGAKFNIKTKEIERELPPDLAIRIRKLICDQVNLLLCVFHFIGLFQLNLMY